MESPPKMEGKGVLGLANFLAIETWKERRKERKKENGGWLAKLGKSEEGSAQPANND